MNTIENDLQLFKQKISTATQLIHELEKTNQTIIDSGKKLDEINDLINKVDNGTDIKISEINNLIDKIDGSARASLEKSVEEHRNLFTQTESILGQYFIKFNNELFLTKDRMLNETSALIDKTVDNFNTLFSRNETKFDNNIIEFKNALESLDRKSVV